VASPQFAKLIDSHRSFMRNRVAVVKGLVARLPRASNQPTLFTASNKKKARQSDD
jgi:hypothetical protein